MAILYFSRSRGLAIVGRYASGDNEEVIQISVKLTPIPGILRRWDYVAADRSDQFPVITKNDFENLVSFIETKIDDQTCMSIIEPELMRSFSLTTAPQARQTIFTRLFRRQAAASFAQLLPLRFIVYRIKAGTPAFFVFVSRAPFEI